jgi:uncharacterized protein YneF (UPF0154 family)
MNPIELLITLLVILVVVGILVVLSFLIFGGSFFQIHEMERDYNNPEKRW